MMRVAELLDSRGRDWRKLHHSNILRFEPPEDAHYQPCMWGGSRRRWSCSPWSRGSTSSHPGAPMRDVIRAIERYHGGAPKASAPPRRTDPPPHLYLLHLFVRYRTHLSASPTPR